MVLFTAPAWSLKERILSRNSFGSLGQGGKHCQSVIVGSLKGLIWEERNTAL